MKKIRKRLKNKKEVSPHEEEIPQIYVMEIKLEAPVKSSVYC